MKTLALHTFHGAARRAARASTSVSASLAARSCSQSSKSLSQPQQQLQQYRHGRFLSTSPLASASDANTSTLLKNSGFWRNRGEEKPPRQGSKEWLCCSSMALGLAAWAAASATRQALCDDLEEAIQVDTHGSEEANWREDVAVGTAMIAFIKNGMLPMVLHKLERLKQIDEPLDNKGSTPLMIASYVGRVKLVDILLKSGADPSKVDSDGLSAVARAASQGHTNVVRRLQRDQRVDLTLQDRFGCAPIHLAVLGAHQATLYWLLKFRVDPNSPTGKSTYATRAPQNETPLHLAVRRLSRPESVVKAVPRFEVMDILLELGADPMKVDSKGDTPMHECCRQGDITGLLMLLAKAPSNWEALTIANKRGDTPMDEADLFAVSHGVLMRFLVLIPKVVTGKLSEFVLSDFAKVMRAGTS